MKELVAAEVRKLGSTRSIYLFLGGVVVLALVSVLDPGHDAATFEKPFHEQTFVLFTSLLTRILILVMGIRVVTDELRHGTIVPTFLVAPRRNRVLAAKVVVVAGAGALLAAAAWIAMTVAAAAVAASEGTALSLDGGAWLSLGGMTFGGAAWGVVGLGLGAVVRSQVAAIVGGLVWLMGIEDSVRGLFGDLAGYLPGQAGLAAALAPGGRALAVAGATMLAYAVLFSLAGARALRHDVS